MTKIISSFNQIELINDLQYLILCDIDNTILHFPDCDIFCKKIIKDSYIIEEDYEKELETLKILYKYIKPPTHTDYNGFTNMIQKINKKHGKLIFLTARKSESDNFTKKHLNSIGIFPDYFEIHYTNSKISKGEYIKKYIDLSIWKNIIFIDDYDTNIKAVSDIYPQIVCYKFVI
jgi:hypothetical protein